MREYKKLADLERGAEYDKELFLKFAFEFVNNLRQNFLDPSLSEVDRKRCKQIVFPAGFYMDENQNVYTPEISPLIRLATNKKDPSKLEKSSMVRVQGL